MTKLKPRKVTLALLLAALLLLISQHGDKDLRFLSEEEESEKQEDEGNVANEFEDPGESGRPVMKTFFQPTYKKKGEDFHDPILDAWKYEWELAGWDTKVLTIEDAKKHPQFDTMKEAVSKVFKKDYYNQLCFFRYLAMAADGGGWMSDYDTFPTNFPLNEGHDLPNDGRFTSFQGHVPALISASADEWARVAQLMVDNIPKTKQSPPSDMYMLMDLKFEGVHDIDFKWPPSYIKKPIETYTKAQEVNCKTMGIGRAIHFSHHSLDQLHYYGKFPIEIGKKPGHVHLKSKDRAAASRKIMDEWREQCGGSNVSSKER